ncbi:MAG: hypothetical protein KBF88_14805 [Polyangiaceae bacterium]|nr:hypothetical protein [Polyangiaceae bacterium]
MKTTRIILGAFALSSLLACSGGDSVREEGQLGVGAAAGNYLPVEGQPDLKIHHSVTLVSERFKREVVIEPNQLRITTAGNEDFLAKIVAKRSVLMSGGIPKEKKHGFTRGILGVSVVGSETILRTMDLPTMAFLKGTVRTIPEDGAAAPKTKSSDLALRDLGDDLESKRNDRLAELISIRKDNLTLLDVEIRKPANGAITIRPVDDSYSNNGTFETGREVGEPSRRGTEAGDDRPLPSGGTSGNASGTLGIKLKMDTRFELAGTAYIGGGGCNILRWSEEGFALGEEAKDLLNAIGKNWWEKDFREGVGAAALCTGEFLNDNLEGEVQMEAFGLAYLNAEITVSGSVEVTFEQFNRLIGLDRLDRLSPSFPVPCGPIPCEVRVLPRPAIALAAEGLARFTTKVPYGLGIVATAGGGHNVQRPGTYPIGRATGSFQGAEWETNGHVRVTGSIGAAVELSFGVGNSQLKFDDYSADARAFVQAGADLEVTAAVCGSGFDWGAKLNPKAKAGVVIIGKYRAETDDLMSPSLDVVLRENACFPSP